jgi:hypothetical protein
MDLNQAKLHFTGDGIDPDSLAACVCRIGSEQCSLESEIHV